MSCRERGLRVCARGGTIRRESARARVSARAEGEGRAARRESAGARTDRICVDGRPSYSAGDCFGIALCRRRRGADDSMLSSSELTEDMGAPPLPTAIKRNLIKLLKYYM